GNLTVSGSCSDTNFVPNTNFAFGGSDSNRTVTITPGTNLVGTATITISVSDGLSTLGQSFQLTVTPVNDAPVLPVQTNRTIAELTTLIVTNTASDVDVPAETLSYQLVAGPTNGVISTNGVITG